MQENNDQAEKAGHDARSDSSEPIGSYLRSKRMDRNITLEEVSGLTGISTKILQALESENRDELPAEVYIKAFYKKYARYLDIDSDEIEAKYQQKTKDSKKKSGHTSNFNTIITIKGQEENFFTETLRHLLLPLIIILSGIFIYWVYKNYQVSFSPFGIIQEYLPAVVLKFPNYSTNFLC